MTATAQDFTTYSGDAILPVFTVKDAGGNPIDISAVQQITWSAARGFTDSPLVSKLKTTGGVAFVTDGTDGQFEIILRSTDTGPLTGYYAHWATITDAAGNVSTVELGRMQVGNAPNWTYSGDPAQSPKDAVRFYLGDTDETDKKVMDGEILFVLQTYVAPLLAAAQCARTLAARYAKMVNKRVGDLAISYSDLAKNYMTLAAELQIQGETIGLAPYSGGTSRADNMQIEQDSDRPPMPFRERQFDNPSGANNTSGGDTDAGDDDQPLW